MATEQGAGVSAPRRPSRMKRYILSIAVLMAMDITMTVVFGPTEVSGFQIVVTAFIVAWLNDEVPT